MEDSRLHQTLEDVSLQVSNMKVFSTFFQVDELTSLMRDNVNRVMNRRHDEEKCDNEDFEERAALLQEQTSQFKRVTPKENSKSLCDSLKSVIYCCFVK